jgi:hypothetical protein
LKYVGMHYYKIQKLCIKGRGSNSSLYWWSR